MGVVVVAGAQVQCSFGQVGNLNVTSNLKRLAGGKPIATIKDTQPMVNISPCGMCSSLANPQVASATAAALGVLTPQPCIPNTPGMWIGGQMKVLIDGAPALTMDAKCMCSWGGAISIVNPGQTKVMAG